jgi:signal transduction histidine kinase
MKAFTPRRPWDSLLAHARRVVRQYTPPRSSSLRHQGLLCTALSLGLIGVFMAVCIATASGQSAQSGRYVIATLIGGFCVHCALLFWFYNRHHERFERLRTLTLSSIALNSLLVGVLSILTWGQDTQYYVLMIVPVIQAAICLDVSGTLVVILLCVLLTFLGAFPLDADEWAEAGAGSLIYTLVGIVVWLLVNDLRDRESRLRQNIEELARTRARLMAEEKLAAVGRLAGAIAHEIRNPVAIISSSLVTAVRNGHSDSERQQLFAIAASEAGRLERLTSDFLAYARTRELQIDRANMADTLEYVAQVARAHPATRGIQIAVEGADHIEADFDVFQLQQALLNIVMNAVEACPPGAQVRLRAEPDAAGMMRIEVINPCGPIAAETTARMFEPFFTTKPDGTGLGLAIARNIARAHDGDLVLSVNQAGRVCFSIEIPQRRESEHKEGRTS